MVNDAEEAGATGASSAVDLEKRASKRYELVETYQGEWKDDCMHGLGEYSWHRDRRNFVGDFESGAKVKGVEKVEFKAPADAQFVKELDAWCKRYR